MGNIYRLRAKKQIANEPLIIDTNSLFCKVFKFEIKKASLTNIEAKQVFDDLGKKNSPMGFFYTYGMTMAMKQMNMIPEAKKPIRLVLIDFIDKYKESEEPPYLIYKEISKNQKKEFMKYCLKAGTYGFIVYGLPIMKIANCMELTEEQWNLIYKGFDIQASELEKCMLLKQKSYKTF